MAIPDFWTTIEPIPAIEMADLLAPHLNHRRLFISACLATDNKFVTALMERTDCSSVLGPSGSPNFDDAAIFWTAFYHMMFKQNPNSMTNAIIEENVRKCASLVNEQFTFFYRQSGRVVEKTIP